MLGKNHQMSVKREKFMYVETAELFWSGCMELRISVVLAKFALRTIGGRSILQMS